MYVELPAVDLEGIHRLAEVVAGLEPLVIVAAAAQRPGRVE
jgi:hypothetical protein